MRTNLNTGRIFEHQKFLELLYEHGAKPEEVKAQIIETFRPFISNYSRLESHAINKLVDTWVSFILLSKYKSLFKYLPNILNIFNEAKTANTDLTFEAVIDWLPELNQATSKLWSMINLERDLKSLPLEDFTAEVLKLIGQILESLAKPYFQLLLQLTRIKRRKDADIEKIRKMDLGKVIDELISTTSLNKVLVAQYNSIRLNQWRNIAYHHTYRVEDKQIICWYNKSGSFEEFTISRRRLFSVAIFAHNVYKIVRIAETLFIVENIEEIRSKYAEKSRREVSLRDEAELFGITSKLNSQGFKVVELKIKRHRALLVVEDMMQNCDSDSRAIHSTQFLYSLYHLSKAAKLVIEYRLFGGEPYLRTEVANDICTKIESKELEYSEMASHLVFSFIHKKATNNINPFSDINISESEQNNKSTFYSQEGDIISTLDFIKLFTLNVFNDYMVARSEGFEVKEIKVVVGKDGGFIITDGKKGKFLFSIPASIKDSYLQEEICSKLNQLINYYENKVLDKQLIEETQIKNKFFLKKIMLKDKLKAK